MSRDVKDRVAARRLLGEPVSVIQIAFDHLDGQAGDIPSVALRTNQGSDLMPVTQQSPRQMGADEAGGACDECSHKKKSGRAGERGWERAEKRQTRKDILPSLLPSLPRSPALNQIPIT